MKDINYTRFGRYVLLEPIARGGMGQVYLSLVGEAGWEKFCAIKKILPQAGSPEALLRFKSEAEINVHLNHSNLVSVFDVGVIGQEAYMAMELVEGDNLRSVWNRCATERKAFPVPVALFIIKEAAKGLAYAHSFEDLSLVHRDISPPNLMISYSGEVKILDFGLALSSFSKRFTKPGIVYGKLPYLSPEQARGEELSDKTDVYSLGIILWEMLTGKRMFELSGKENVIKELKKRGTFSDVKPPSVVGKRGDAELDSIVFSMLSFDPAERPNAAEASSMIAKYLASAYPGTDSGEVAKFMDLLFAEDKRKCKEKHKELLASYREASSERTDEEIRPGDVIADRYIIKKEIGEGGMGKVFEAEHKSIGKKVAVKILEPKGGMNPEEAGKRFEREARAASRIHHPSVVDVIDYGFTDGAKPFLVMEYLDGQNVGDLLAKKPFDLQKACILGSQLAYGLHAAHEAGLIHRDIKPDNIYIVKDHMGRDNLKIIDFGIAKSFGIIEEDLTRPGITLGTPEYIAPELLLGEKPTTAADIYSFGAVLYEFLSGKPPYVGAHTENIIQNKLKGKRKSIHDLRPDAPPMLRVIVESCLSQEPTQRPASLRAVAEQLDRIYNDLSGVRSISSELTPVPERASKAVRPSVKKATRRMMPSEQGSGNWVPLILAVLGITAFTAGIIKAGKTESTRINRFVSEITEFAPLIIDVEKEIKIADLSSDIETDDSLNHEKLNGGIVKQPRRRVFKAKKHVSKSTLLLRKAENAFNRGQYSVAFELSRRSLKLGGGSKARVLYGKAGKMLGLK